MATVKSLLWKLQRGNKGCHLFLKNHVNDRHSNVSGFGPSRCSLSTASTDTPIHRRKRGRTRMEEGIQEPNHYYRQYYYHPPSTVSHPSPFATTLNRHSRRRFSNTSVAMDNNPKENHNHDNDPHRQLNQLLEGAESIRSRCYENVWDLSSGRNINSECEKQKGSKNTTAKTKLSPLHLFPLDSDKRLDRQSRFVLELLQTLKEVGLTNTSDRVTTERCNSILKKLAMMTREKSSGGDNESGNGKPANNGTTNQTANQKRPNPVDRDVASVIDSWQRIERARAILESMESYLPLQQHSARQIPTELPVPSHETYFSILRLYSSAKQLSAKDLDRLRNSTQSDAQNVALLEAANEAPLEAKAIVERMEASGKLALVPTSLHWNQVLSCQANAIRRSNRPLEAATLLYKLLQTQNNNNTSGSIIISERDGTSRNKSSTDASSFAHVLRACANDMALEDYESYRSGGGAQSKGYVSKPKEAFAKLALAVAERVWKGLQKEQEIGKESANSEEVSPQNRRDHLSGLLDDGSDGRSSETTGSSSSRETIVMNSHHFVHMLKAGRNFGTLFSAEPQNRQNEQPTSSVAGRELLDLRQHHEEWMRRVLIECSEHQKVNIHVLQEVMYQGATLLFEDTAGRGHNSTSENESQGADAVLDWVGRILLPPVHSSDAACDADIARFRSRWDKEIVPSLLESKAKQEQPRSYRSRRRLESVYASSIRQTRILLRCLPSRWRARAD